MATLAPPIPPTTDGVRPAKSDIRNLMVACPSCRYWHEIPTSGAIKPHLHLTLNQVRLVLDAIEAA